jgi:hypothetical protein
MMFCHSSVELVFCLTVDTYKKQREHTRLEGTGN